MRVVHCITGLSGDGAQRMLLRLAECLQARGVCNHVVSLSIREPLADVFEAQGIPVYASEIRQSPNDLGALWRMRRFLNKVKPNILQGWMYHANTTLSMMRPFLEKSAPLVWNIRRGMDDYAERKLSTRAFIQANRWLSAYPEKIIYCTHESRVQHEAFGFQGRPGVVVGNGFNTEIFVPSDDRRRMTRDRYGVSEDEILIGNVGRDDSAKGREFLFEAFSRLVEKVPAARLLLVGRGLNDANQELRRTLVARGIVARVLTVGEYSPLSDIYPAMDILCSSSVAEGFPNVIAEAMASGVACVATDTGNTRELLEGNGVVVPTRSAVQLADGLIQLCSESAEARKARGRRARDRIIARYSLASVADSYVSLYESLGSGVRGGEG